MNEVVAGWFSSLWDQISFNLIEGERYKMILDGLGTTVTIALFAALLGVILGTLIAFMRLSNLKIVRGISTAYVAVMRGTPVVVQLMIMYFIILRSYNGTKTEIAILAFGLNSGAYVSEMIRAGILAIDKGQTEAGRSLGLTGASTMMLIVMPQALKVAIPSLFNEFIILLKETSVVGMIGLMDLTKSGDFIRSRTFEPYVPLFTVALVYLVIVLGLTYVFGLVERRMRQGDQR